MAASQRRQFGFCVNRIITLLLAFPNNPSIFVNHTRVVLLRRNRLGGPCVLLEEVMTVAVENVRVFILAENRLLREALTRILRKKSNIDVVGASALASQVTEQVTAAAPDVLLSDSAAMSLAELRLVPELRAAVPGLKVVMIGMDADRETFLRAVRDGVVGYMLKDASALEIADAVRCVVGDEAVCPPQLCLALFDYVAQHARMPSFHIRYALGLTRREQQLVQLIGLGLTNKEIANQLNLSEQTVKNHVHRMLRKVGASDRLGVVELCRTQGIAA